MKPRNSTGSTLVSGSQRRQSSPSGVNRPEAMETIDKEEKVTKNDHSPLNGSKEKLRDSKHPGSVLTEDGDLTGDPRSRTSSLDAHQSQFAKKALEKLLQVFSKPSSSFPSLDHPRNGKGKHSTRSGSPLTKSRSAESSVGNSNQQLSQPKRRFMRVVRDAEAPPPEQLDDNPHTICRYTQKYLAEHYSQKSTDDEHKPYTTTGHTILKKSSGSGGELTVTSPSEQAESGSPSVNSKRATFFGEVEVIEYSLKDKAHNTHTTPIRFDDDSSINGIPVDEYEKVNENHDITGLNGISSAIKNATEKDANKIDGLVHSNRRPKDSLDGIADRLANANANSNANGSVDKRGIDDRIEGATSRVTFNNPSSNDEDENLEDLVPIQEENKENMQISGENREKMQISSLVQVDNKVETKLKPSVSTSSFNNIFSPIGEVVSKSSLVEATKESNEKRASPGEVEPRTKSVRLMDLTTTTSLSQKSSGTSWSNSSTTAKSLPQKTSGSLASNSSSITTASLPQKSLGTSIPSYSCTTLISPSSSSPASLAQSPRATLGGSTPSIATSPTASPRGGLCALQKFGGVRQRGSEEDFTMAA